MRVFQNLLGDHSKIHSDEIVVGNKSEHQILTERINELGDLVVLRNTASGVTKIKLPNHGMFLLMLSAGASNSNSIGVYAIHTYGSGYGYIHTIKDIGFSITAELTGRELVISRTAAYGYALLQLAGSSVAEVVK